MEQSDSVEVRRVRGKVRGVFALRAIPEGEVIETCPVLVVPTGEVRSGTAWTRLAEYCFDWWKVP